MSYTKKIASVASLVILATGISSWVAASTPSVEKIGDKIGTTYPIAEKHAIREIEARLKAKQDSGQLAAMQKEVQDRINRSALNLQPLEGLAKATKGSVRYFDPSYTLTETIYDQDGQIIAPAGTVVKPLEVAPILFKMFFFDGREPDQIELAKKLAAEYGESFMPILTAGNWYELSLEMNQAVYYDQEGRMSKSFQLNEVPSLVSQERDRLRVEVMKP
ncbi:TPA: conjugal transfer protein TraW [Neisseria meningitidis]